MEMWQMPTTPYTDVLDGDVRARITPTGSVPNRALTEA